MALDHYVSQVHLRNFYSPALDGKKMFAIRKSDLKQFPCGSADVCRIEDGSTTQYLEDPRAIEKFVKPIEQNYNLACSQILNNEMTEKAIFVISGFATFVGICAPTSQRIHLGSLEELTKIEAELLDRMGNIPKAPAELGGKSLSELIRDGAIKVETDPNYPKAIGVSNFRRNLFAFGNFSWDILLNDWPDSPFLTSDFPLAVEETIDPRLINRVLPLTPKLAIRIRPRLDLSKSELASERFEHFRFRRVKLDHSEARKINQTIVRSAEDMVFASGEFPWLTKFVERNRRYCVQGIYDKIPKATGFISLTRTRVIERAPVQ